jgi:hypothetical protein
VTINHPTNRPEPVIIAAWAREDEFEPETVRVFSGNEYADWAETNHLADAFPWPARFYGILATGTLVQLDHQAETGPYDEDDYATVTHTWRATDTADRLVYTVAVARRDGRA